MQRQYKSYLTNEQINYSDKIIRIQTNMNRILCFGSVSNRLQLDNNFQCYTNKLYEDFSYADLTRIPLMTSMNEFLTVFISNECRKLRSVTENFLEFFKQCQIKTEYDILREFFKIVMNEFGCAPCANI